MWKFGLVIVLFITEPAIGQKVVVETDTTKADSVVIMRRGKIIDPVQYSARYIPRKALLYSAVFPGMGQVYNKKYWKLPIVYGGFYVLTYVAFRYNDLYNQYKNELYQVVRDKGYVPPSGYTESQLRSVTEFYRRQRDFFLILDGMWYLLQLVDAHVDAHLREFDLNPQLKVSLGPSMQYNPLIGSAPGFGITLTF